MPLLELTPGAIVTLVCSLEVAAPKPGNVHRGADFDDATLEDFLVSGIVFGQVVDQLPDAGTGQIILSAVQATQSYVGSNTNLGLILLLTPLAQAVRLGCRSSKPQVFQTALRQLLDEVGQDQTSLIFQAIREANPGGLGSVELGDVRERESSENLTLIQAMKLVSEFDLVARQYVNQFNDVFEYCLPALMNGLERFRSLSHAIVFTHVSLMAHFPDSLIWRKCGKQVAYQSQMLAGKILDRDSESIGFESRDEVFWSGVADLDFWLRSDGRRRNPGTTADMVAAGLFVAIAAGMIDPPFR